MKIAITGHTKGIGQALAKVYADQGHTIVGMSRTNGYNIRVIPKLVNTIAECDMFINNAQAGFAQTELLFEVYNSWANTRKKIIVISTMMTQHPISIIPGLDQYRVQKIALEEAVMQLRAKKLGPEIILVRPGDIATTPEKTVPPSADVDVWAHKLVTILDLVGPELAIGDLSLGPSFYEL